MARKKNSSPGGVIALVVGIFLLITGLRNLFSAIMLASYFGLELAAPAIAMGILFLAVGGVLIGLFVKGRRGYNTSRRREAPSFDLSKVDFSKWEKKVRSGLKGQSPRQKVPDPEERVLSTFKGPAKSTRDRQLEQLESLRRAGLYDTKDYLAKKAKILEQHR